MVLFKFTVDKEKYAPLTAGGASASELWGRPPPHGNAAWRGEERPNVPRSAIESSEAARDEAPSAVAGGCLSPRWKCVRLHGSECSAETGADERPLIAVSAGNLNTAKRKRLCQDVAVSSSQYGKNTNFSPVFHLAESLAKTFCWLFLWNFKEKASTIFYNTAF